MSDSDVDANLRAQGTTLVVVNSVCGCAAGNARPGVMLALQQLESDPRLARSTYRVEELRAAIAKGRTWLIEAQRADGSWPETMRGSATTSEAQRLSTTAWALIALLSGSK